MKAPTAVVPSLAAAVLVAGCLPEQRQEPTAPPFVFRSLELRQKDAEGQPSWEITSPEARYDLGRKLAQARELRGLIYANGRPLYRVSATRGVVLNDGEVVQLEGPTRVERLGKDPLVISALRVRWYPQQGRMLLDRQPYANQRRLTLTARRAVFDFNADRLELSGEPELIDRGPAQTRLALKRVQWWAASGNLLGEGPVRGTRTEQELGQQTLLSPSLSGNTIRQELLLAAPVEVVVPGEQAALRAQTTRIDLQRQTISSELPFKGRRGAMQASGQSFRLQGQTTTLIIPAGCELSQPGDRLTADACSWNWRTNQMQARGGVELRREQNGLITRANQLDGRAARDGSVVFTQPGGRVTTQFRIPSGSGTQGRSAGTRLPIQL
jgi:LPS export ABC transporter protein LptC